MYGIESVSIRVAVIAEGFYRVVSEEQSALILALTGSQFLSQRQLDALVELGAVILTERKAA